MKFNRKKITAAVLAGLMMFSTLADSGVLASAADVGVVFATMNGQNISGGDTVNYRLNRDSASFVSMNKAGTAWDGPLWIFDGTGKVSGNAAYCMALGKAASSSNQYKLTDAKANAEAISTKLESIGKEKVGKVMNAISRFMYPVYTDSANIEFYMTRINETYAAGGQNVNGYPVIGGVPLQAKWDTCNWWRTFAVITTASTAFGDRDNISNKNKAATISSDEYRGLSQAVVWEMMDDLKPYGIKAKASGNTCLPILFAKLSLYI